MTTKEAPTTFSEGTDVRSSHKASKHQVGTVIAFRPSETKPGGTEYQVAFTVRKVHWIEESFLTKARIPRV